MRAAKEPPKRFIVLAKKLAPMFKHIEVDIKRAGMEVPLTLHLADALHKAFNAAMVVIVSLAAFSVITETYEILKYLVFLGPALFGMMFYSTAYQPRVRALRKGREIERELPYALRHLLIEMKSGVPIYNGLVVISEKYGAASDEVKLVLKDINGGLSQIEAIEKSIIRSPSEMYRSAFWQLLNAMKTGTNVEAALDNTVKNIIQKQLISIKRYGQELNPWTLMYMMVGVIMPSLGITFLMILSTFTGVNISNALFYALLFGLMIFQLFFMNIVKTKRPQVKV